MFYFMAQKNFGSTSAVELQVSAWGRGWPNIIFVYINKSYTSDTYPSSLIYGKNLADTFKAAKLDNKNNNKEGKRWYKSVW